MAIFSTTAKLLVEPTAYTPATLPPLPLEAWQLAIIEWTDAQTTGFVNKAASIPAVQAALPGIVINGARIAPNGYKRPRRDGPLDSGVVPIQKATVKLQDKGRAFSSLVSNNRASGIGVRGKVMRVYEWEAGEELDLAYNLVGTYRLDDRSWLNGQKSLTGLDIRRDLKKQIFEPEAYNLASSLGSVSTTITMNLPYSLDDKALPFMQHDERYSSNPSELVLYVQLGSGEIVKLPSGTTTRVSAKQVTATSIERGALNTRHLIGAVPVDAGTTSDNLPELAEWIYIEETLPNLIRLITVGETFDGRAAAGSHHTINMDVRWLDEDSLLYSAPELASLPLRAENYGAVTVKDLIETEILPFLPGSMQVSAAGQIQLRRITKVTDYGSSVYTFDSSVIDRSKLSAITTKVSHIKSAVAIRAGWDARTEKFGTPIFLTDGGLTNANDSTLDAEALILESKLLHSSIQTFAQIRRLIPALAEHYLGELMIFSFQVKATAAVLDVGARCNVHLVDVPDDASSQSGAPDINRSFVVTSVGPSGAGMLYQVTGTSGQGARYEEALSAPSLSDEEYTRNSVPLEDDLPAGALVEIGGIYYLQPGTYPVSFKKKYRFTLGPLYHTAGSTITCADGEEGPMFKLFIPHAWHSDSATTVITTGKGTTLGGAAGQVGGNGYAVPTVGVGSMTVTGSYSQADESGDTQVAKWNYSSSPGVRAESYQTGDIAAIALSYNDGILQGLPADLSGYAGCGGGQTRINSRYRSNTAVYAQIDGGAGKRGSAGVMIICRGPTMSLAARFITTGLDGDAPPTLSAPGDAQLPSGSNGLFTGAAGSASGPGIVIIGIDGPFPSIDIEAHVEAYPGITQYSAGTLTTRMPGPTLNRTDSSSFTSHYRALDEYVNMASACTRVIYMPAAATVQEKPQGIFSSLAITRQQTGQISIRTTASAIVAPSYGLPGDLGIWDVALAGTSITPSAWIMNDAYQWVIVDWDLVETDYATLLFVSRTYGGTESVLSATRPTGKPAGTHWLNSTNETEWILGVTPSEDIAFRVKGVPIGVELLNNGNFAGGDTGYVFTRDANLQPVNIFQLLAESIAQAFITHGVIEGEYEAAGTGETAPAIPAPTSATATVISDTSVQVTWVQQNDTTGIASQEIIQGGAVVATSTGDPSVISGLAAGTEYTFLVLNVGTDGTRSATVSDTVTTTDSAAPAGQIGIVLTHTGEVQADGTRKVAGTAYQNNASIPIEESRQITLTLLDGSEIGPNVVGVAADFEFLLSSAYDANLNQLASIYTNNGSSATEAQLNFTYEL
jgi:hypothetical protein